MFNKLLICVLFCFIIYEVNVCNGDLNNDRDTPEDIPQIIPKYPMPQYRENTTEIEFFPRIIGGIMAMSGEFPGKISLQLRRGSHICGAVLIQLRHVLTAAHCVTSEVGAVFNVNLFRLMGDDLLITLTGSPSRQIRFPTHIFVHLWYSARTFENDIAVIRADAPFEMTHTFAVTLRNLESPVIGQRCTLAGWGATTEGGDAHPRLLRVDLEVKDTNICNGSSSYNGLVPPGSFCAGAFRGGVDACQGDSGGALICNGRVTGLVSSGYGCGRPNFPGIYVDVSLHHGWIEHTMMFNGTHIQIPRPTTISPGMGSTILPSTCLTVLTVIILSYILHV